jgi:Tol biopolymer transport system component
MKKKRKVSTDDLLALKFVESVVIAPDEKEIALTVKTVAEKNKKYHSHIYMVNADGSNLRQYTFGEVSDSAPVFSPDGKWMAFQSKRGEKKGIYVMPRDGGEARLAVDKDGGYADITFTPDSKKIICCFRPADEVPKDEHGKKEAPVYRHITRLLYKMDNYGFYPVAELQIWAFDVDTGKGTALTKGSRSKENVAVSPDGRSLVYVMNTAKDRDIDQDALDLFVMPIKGGKARKLPTPPGPAFAPKFSPDGKWVAYLGHDNPDDAWGITNVHVWKVPMRGGKAIDLTKKLDRMTFDLTISDTAEAHSIASPVWSADGKWIYFLMTNAGSTHLLRVSASGRKLETVLGGKVHVPNFSVAGKSNLVAVTMCSSQMQDAIPGRSD